MTNNDIVFYVMERCDEMFLNKDCFKQHYA